jgi:hypothetical protein
MTKEHNSDTQCSVDHRMAEYANSIDIFCIIVLLFWVFLVGFVVPILVAYLVVGEASAEELRPYERYQIARDIAREQKRIGSGSGSSYRYEPERELWGVIQWRDMTESTQQPKYVPKATISWEEIKQACGAIPTDDCIRRYYDSPF